MEFFSFLHTSLQEERSNLESVIGPGTDLEEAALRVVREILDVHETGGLVNGGRLPVDRAVEVDRRLRHHRHLVVAVRAAAREAKGIKGGTGERGMKIGLPPSTAEGRKFPQGSRYRSLKA